VNLFPIVAFDLIKDAQADECLAAWGHWLGGCNRPFGRQSWGLSIHGEVLAVAVSASTVNGMCGGYPRGQVVELARLCAHPDHRELTRVALRLWRVVAPGAWGAAYWQVVAVVSYANAVRHTGDLPVRWLEEGRRGGAERGRRDLDELPAAQGWRAEVGMGLRADDGRRTEGKTGRG
jgi:hypothetical protein